MVVVESGAAVGDRDAGWQPDRRARVTTPIEATKESFELTSGRLSLRGRSATRTAPSYSRPRGLIQTNRARSLLHGLIASTVPLQLALRT
jgi:hypothetical protein